MDSSATLGMPMLAQTHFEHSFQEELFQSISFPAHGRLIPGESGPSFILRMAQKNHVTYPEILRHLELNPFPYIPIDIAAKMAPLFGELAANISKATVNTYKIFGQVHTVINNQLLKKSYLSRQRYPQVCPLCLDEAGYAALTWDITCYTACLTHQIVLMDRCPACKKRLQWSRPTLFNCNCGQALCEFNTNWRKATESELLVSEVFAS